LKATGQGGHVVIDLSGTEKEVAIAVKDDGSGIRTEDLPFIFERFFRGPGGGLGIGLTIVRELVEAHGGRVEAKSTYGSGSTFTVYLPRGDIHNSS
jgi:signal transduction histidine kinase